MIGDTPRSGLPTILEGLRLVRLADYEQRRLWGMRIALAYAVWIAIAGAVLMLAVARDGAGGALGLIVVRATTWSSWVAGGLALWSAAGACAGPQTTSAVSELAMLRGYSRSGVQRGRTVAITVRAASLTAVAPLLLACLSVAWTRSISGLLWTAALCIAVALYSIVLGACVALIARLSCAMCPNHPRSAAMALVVIPHLAHLAWPHVPSIPTLFGWLLQRLTTIGAMTA